MCPRAQSDDAMTVQTNKRPTAIRVVIPFVFRHWLQQPGRAAVVAGGLLVGMLFEGWPGIEDARGRALTLAAVAVVSGALYAVLSVYADGLRWTRAESADWVAHAGLNAIGAGVILHVGIGRRRPFS